MKLSTGVRQFWLVIGYSLLWAIVVTGLIAYFSGWRYAVVGAVIMLSFTVWEIYDIKQKLLRSHPDQLEFQPVTPNDFAFQLDVATLEQQTKELEALGFIHLQDYAVQPLAGLARCFAHPQHYCFAEVGQIIDADGKTIIGNSLIFSPLSDGWNLVHVQGSLKASSSLSLLWRNPKSVGVHHPDVKLDDLLEIHLRFRQKMVQDLGIVVLTDVSWEAYKAEQQKGTRDRKQLFQRRNFLVGMIKVTLFELNPTLEWLGAYAKPGKRSI